MVATTFSFSIGNTFAQSAADPADVLKLPPSRRDGTAGVIMPATQLVEEQAQADESASAPIGASGTVPGSAETFASDDPASSASASHAAAGLNNPQVAAVAPGAKKAAPMPRLKGQVTFCVPMGTPIKLKLATVPLFKMNLMNRDLEGNLLPAQVNMPITAKVSEDIYVDDSKVIPAGTVFKGRVSKVFPPRRNGRPGSVALEFNQFQTPDGRRFAFHVEANNTRKSTWKSKARGTGRLAAHAAGGAIVGALIAYQLFGYQGTVAMHGYNVAGGAAAGALTGIGIALWQKGKKAVLEPGDDLNMQIDRDMLIPAATAPTAKKAPPSLDGLEVHVLKSKLIKDGLDGYQLRIKATVLNDTDREFRSLDLYMLDELGKRHSVVSDADDKAEVIFHVDPHSMKDVYFSFAVEFPKLKRKLILVDPLSRRVIHEQQLP
jgi:hypothetical protein